MAFVTLIAGVLNGDTSLQLADKNIYKTPVELEAEALSALETETLNPRETVYEAEDITDSVAGEVFDTQKLYKVIRVVDGDTIVISKDGVNESVRLIGVDTPETVHPTKAVQCFGREASLKTKEWLEGREVHLVIDEGEGERDKYRRLLGYIFRDDGLFINLELIKQGYAYEYTYDSSYKYQAEFMEAEEEAQVTKQGLWDDFVCSDASLNP